MHAASAADTSGAPRLQFLPLQVATAAQSPGISVSSSTHGTLQLAASDSAKTVSAPADASGSSHTGSDGQSSDPKSSDSNSAAAQTAGLAQAAVSGPLHAPAGPSGSTETPASASAAALSSLQPASAPQNSLPSVTSRPAQLPSAAQSSLNDAVQASQLYQHGGGAEMHIVMSTDLLGAVDVHAMVRQSTVTATIGVQRPEVQSLLASDLPALQHALSEHSLHVEQISVLGGSTGNQMDMGRQSPQNQRSWQSPLAPSGPAGYEGDSLVARVGQSSASAISAGNYAEGRLSIHV